MKKTLQIFPFLFFFQSLAAETIVFKDCSSEDYNYEKNEYILNLEKNIMTREFIYSKDTFEKLRLNDITIKKENKTTKGIIEENGLIVSEISGYPAFYTQMIFDKKNSNIKIKTVLNNTEGESLIATCKNIINYKKES